MDELELVKVNAVQDESGHWYVIPIELIGDFNFDLENIDDGGFGFDFKYSLYRTGGDLNNIQLYANV